MSSQRFLQAAASVPGLLAELGRAERALAVPGAKLQKRQFLSSGFQTSARSPFAQVLLLFRLAHNGQLPGAPAVRGTFKPVRDPEQTLNDLGHWGMVTRGRMTRLGAAVLEAYRPEEVARGEPEGQALSEFHLRFLRLVDEASGDDKPRAWRMAAAQAERMADWAAERWPGHALSPHHVVLLDFLSSDGTGTTAGPVPLLAWRTAWSDRSDPDQWRVAGAQLCGSGGDVEGNLQLPCLLSRYFARDQQGGARAVQLTVDIFRHFTQGTGTGAAAVPPPQQETRGESAPSTAKPVVTRQVQVKVRERTEPERQKDACGRRCQLCGGFVRRKEGSDYVEAAHILPFGALDVDGVAGNYLVLCPHHHKAFDLGLVSVQIPRDKRPESFTIELHGPRGEPEKFTVRPVARQVEHGFWEHLRQRFP